MIKILLVDDDQIVRRGLREHIDWEALGAHVCGEAINGEEALDLIREYKPHIIISDIKMPYKNGLEMITEAKEVDPECSVIFISGHDEFAYVQKALKLGAFDYILKPIDPLYLQERLKDIIISIQTRKKEQSAMEISHKAQLRQFLQALILGNESPQQIRQNPLSDSEELINHHFYILSLQIDLFYQMAGDVSIDNDVDLHRRAFYHFIDVFDAASVYRISESLSSYEICLSANSLGELKEQLQMGIAAIQKKTKALDFTVTIGVSNPASSLRELHQCFHDAQDALELKFMKGGNAVYHARDYQIYRNAYGGDEYLPDTNLLMQAMKGGTIAELEVQFQVIRENLLKSKDPKRTLHWLSADVLHQIIFILGERGFSIDEVFDNPLSEWEKLGKSQTVEIFSERFIYQLTRITNYIALRRDYHASQILDQAIGYVKLHFQDKTLSLDDVASSAGMSPCYFSVIFKQQTGKTFSLYLTDLRINKAKDLILYTDDRSYEIGPKVGYDNASYFSTVFKKSTGMSPTEYKKRFS
ncbi:MAG: response regulator [Sphaerochaeta sp.]|nr:response regulator [Sphaerochaeta sp.]